MTKYRVYLYETISSSVDVDADSPDAAEDAALREGLPSVMFTNHRYPDEGEWEVDSVEEIGAGS